MKRTWPILPTVTALFSLACIGSTPTLDLQAVQLPRVNHAAAVPLRAFAIPTGVVSDCSRHTGPFLYAVVELTPTGMRVSGTELPGTLVDGLVPADQKRGKLISALYDRLLELSEAHIDAAHRGCNFAELSGDPPQQGSGRLLLSVDARIPAATLAEVVFTAANAQRGTLYLRVLDPTPDRALPAPLGNGKRAGPRLTAPDPGSLSWRAVGAGPRSIPRAELGSLPTDAPILYLPHASEPIETLAAVLDALPLGSVAQLGRGLEGTPRPLVATASGGAPTKLRLDTEIPVLVFGPETEQARARLPIGRLQLAPLEGHFAGVEAVVARQKNALRSCAAKSATPETTVEIEFDVRADGTVARADVTDGGSAPPQMQGCLAGRFMHMKFPKPPEPTTVRQRMTFHKP